MAPTRMEFDMTFRSAGAPQSRRDGAAPLRLLLLADFGGDRSTPLRARKPLPLDIDNFDAQLARVAPRLALTLDGQRMELAFASLEDFHPDRLFARLPVFGALRKLRDEARDAAQFRRAAAALGLGAAPAAAAAPSAPPAPDAAAAAASDLERLLGRAPGALPAVAAAPATAAPGGAAAVVDRWRRDLVSCHEPGSPVRSCLSLTANLYPLCRPVRAGHPELDPIWLARFPVLRDVVQQRQIYR